MLILASASPRRSELLKLITEDFVVIPSDVEEHADIAGPAQLVMELARQKARDVWERRAGTGDVVVGADTLVYACGEILGKPADEADARRMIRLLSGREHTVYTGVCVIQDGRQLCEVFGTQVEFEEVGGEELDAYLATAQVMDKAGAYAVQEQAAKFVRGIHGCYFNVMGLPVSGLYRMLKTINCVWK